MNPLEAGEDRSRWIWHTCPCCPPMFLKLMGAMPGYIYSTDDDSVYVNLFVSSEARTTLKQNQLSIKQSSRYPWDGNVKIAVNPTRPTAFNLMVRIPEWCRGATLKVNGERFSNLQKVRGYNQIERTWSQGDLVELIMPMPVDPVKAHPLVEADAGKVALMRGPIVYCLESADNGKAVRRMAISARVPFSSDYRPDLLKGVTIITGSARLLNAPVWQDSLYAAARDLPETNTVRLTAIPYYANTNRGPVDMTVWLPEAS
jgi:uncharacterized protein